MDFESEFKKLTGFKPMNWQVRLFDESFSNGKLPTAVDIPTGLGKTAIVAIWMVALAQQMKSGQISLPRRLVYVVDRRAVVDQATKFAEDLRKNLAEKPEAKELRNALGLADSSLPISTLRGQFVDNRDWLADPTKPAIIVGTVDMIGSRLLFEGYGVSRKMRPYHAGLLGTDTLVMLDEAHLVPPFEALLAEITESAGRYGPQDEELGGLLPKFQLLPLSATGRRQTAQPFVLEQKDFLDDDKKVVDAVVNQRLHAKKRLIFQELGDKKLEDALAERAWDLAQEKHDRKGTEAMLKPVRVIVYCNSRDVAEKIKTALDKKVKNTTAKGRTELFVGARRVKERTDAEQRLKELRFLAGTGEQTAPAFLVATSAGEVGIDLDADHLVCDLVAWERMVQRFGRVNRRGSEGRQAEIVVFHSPPEKPTKPREPSHEALSEPEKPKAPGRKATNEERTAYNELKAEYDKKIKEFKKKKKKQEDAQQKFDEAFAQYQKVLAEIRPHRLRVYLLQRLLKGNVSPEALRQLNERASAQMDEGQKLAKLIADASTPTPLRPALNRALVDAWSMTSLPEHTGRPEVAPWLRGWVDEKPQTTVAWRKHLPVRAKPKVTKKEIEDFFEAAPIHTSETLETETFRVMEWLQAWAEMHMPGDIIGMLLGTDMKLVYELKRQDIPPSKGASDNDKKRFQSLLSGKTLVMSANFGGVKDGLLSNDEDEMPTTADSDAAWMDTDVTTPVIRFRVIGHNAESEEGSNDVWHESSRFELERNADGEVTRWLSIQKWHDTSNTENDRAEGRPQALAEHQSWAAKRAEAIGKRLGLPEDYITMLAVAARLHDEGKRASNWQRAFRAERDAKKFKIDGPLAKTRGPINQAVLGGYRHEFGSLPHAKDDAEFQKLPQEMQDFVLHLIAAHHGFARPLITTKGCEEAPRSLLEERAREVALRFARLQKRWGSWGLAWWESLLRAADAQASRANDERKD